MTRQLLHLFTLLWLGTPAVQAQDTSVQVARFWGNRQGALCLTFDDGLQDQYTLAFPQLKRRGLKATFAIIGSKVGGTIHSSQDRAMGISGSQAMTWDMLREMAADGQEISSHGWAHRKVTRLSPEELRYEVQHNDSVIYQETGQLPRTFFYPGNGRDSATIAYCEQERVGSRLFQIAIGAKHDAGWLCRWADGLVERREWGIGMTHGIAMGYDHFPDPGVLWTFLDYVAARQDSLWIATFHDVAAYVKERDAARLTVSRHKKTIEVNIQTGLAPHLFRQPLTLILRGMRVRQVMQDGRPLPIYQHQGQTLVDAAPQGGKLLIKLRR